jgi:tetratricopeptide (TPR) repeat protein
MIESHRILGQFDEALLWVDKCIDKMPNSLFPVVRKASLLSLVGRREEAEALAKQLLALEPNFSVDAWAKGQPYRKPEHIEPFAEALRQIGLPD